METTTPNSQNYFNKPPANKDVKKIDRKKAGCGCLMILAFISIPFLFFLAYHTIFPELFPTWIRGDVQNIGIFPSNGKERLWIQTDGSFGYIQETKTTGSYSIGRKGLFEKTFTYVLDPVTKEVLKGSYTGLDFLPAAPEILYINNKLWVITPSVNSPAFIEIYNPDTYEKIMNTEQFCAQIPELATGIQNLYYEKSLPARLNFTSKDGRDCVYDLKKEKIFPNYAELSKYYRNSDSSQGNIFTLENEKNSNSRKVLYYISGPQSQLYFTSPRGESIIENKNSTNEKLNAVPILHSKAFLESELLYFDDDIAVVIHQNILGKTADRMLTCVDKSGKELWTIPQEELFDDIKVEEDNAFSVIFFIKSKFAVQRSGNVVVFVYKPEDAMGFDLNTGKKLWEFAD